MWGFAVRVLKTEFLSIRRGVRSERQIVKCMLSLFETVIWRGSKYVQRPWKQTSDSPVLSAALNPTIHNREE